MLTTPHFEDLSLIHISLSDYFSPQEWEKVQGSYTEEELKDDSIATRIWNEHKRFTGLPREEYLQDHASRKILGHLNSVKDTDQFQYEGVRAHGAMLMHWQRAISTLPADIVETDIGGEKYQQLQSGFLPSTSTSVHAEAPDFFCRPNRYSSCCLLYTSRCV